MTDSTLQEILSAGLVGYVAVDSATGRAPTAPQLGVSAGVAILLSRIPGVLQQLADPTTLLHRMVHSYALIAFGIAYGVSRTAGHPVRMSLGIASVVGIGSYAYYAPPHAKRPAAMLEPTDDVDNRLGFEGRPLYSKRQVFTTGSSSLYPSMGRKM